MSTPKPFDLVVRSGELANGDGGPLRQADGGAHVSIISDGSLPTCLLSQWGCLVRGPRAAVAVRP